MSIRGKMVISSWSFFRLPNATVLFLERERQTKPWTIIRHYLKTGDRNEETARWSQSWVAGTEAGGSRARRRQAGRATRVGREGLLVGSQAGGRLPSAARLGTRHPGLCLQVPRDRDKHDGRGHDQGGKRRGPDGPRAVCAGLLKRTNTCAQEPKSLDAGREQTPPGTA